MVRTDRLVDMSKWAGANVIITTFGDCRQFPAKKLGSILKTIVICDKVLQELAVFRV
jgi:hypothetical protein